MTDNVINFKFKRNTSAPFVGSLSDIVKECADSEHSKGATGFILLFDCPDGVKGTAVNVTNGDMLWLGENLRMMAVSKEFD
jgi:hypothetical protein